jgi:hypothetical protein
MYGLPRIVKVIRWGRMGITGNGSGAMLRRNPSRAGPPLRHARLRRERLRRVLPRNPSVWGCGGRAAGQSDGGQVTCLMLKSDREVEQIVVEGHD